MADCIRLLVVDDEEDICEILKFNLESEGYHVDTAHSAEEALSMDIRTYRLLLLDVMMGEISGFKMAKQLKSDPQTAGIPIIFITAKDTETDTVTGLSIGADDYIAKPFSLREVSLRVKAVLRRTSDDVVRPRREEEKQDTLQHGGLLLDRNRKRAGLDGVPLPLTKKELEILEMFLENIGRVFTRDDILEKIWKNEVTVSNRTVDVNITRLRKKLGRYGQCIATRQGYGYCFEDTDT